MRRPTLPLLAFPLMLSACGDDKIDPVFLGPVEAGTGQDATTTVTPPDAVSLTHGVCEESTPVVGKDLSTTVRTLATLQSLVVVAREAAVSTFQLDGQGCPSSPVATFGENGTVAIDAVAAAPLPDRRCLVATQNGTVVLDSTGEQVGSCQRNGNEIVVRSLQTNSNGEAAGVLTKSPVSRMVVTSGPSVTCATEQVDLSDSFAYVQVGLGLDGGYVTVEQPEPQLPMIVARYGPTGERVATSARFAGSGAAKLCSATGLVDTDSGVFVTDASCGRVVLFDQMRVDNENGEQELVLYAKGEASVAGTPRGAALTPDGLHVLIAVVSPLGDGASAIFERVALP